MPKISGLDPLSVTPDTLDELAIVDKSDTTQAPSGTTKRVTRANLVGGLVADSDKGVANGVATLDGTGQVPASQLPALATSYKGNWDANTNTPTLVDGVGTAGDIYSVSVAGTQDLGSGPISFITADFVLYSGAVWEKKPQASAVSSVFARTGTVVAASGDYTASQVTNVPSGGIAATDVQTALNELDSEKLDSTSIRERLTANRTYYVRTDGNDANTGLVDSAGGAFLTIQKAVDVVTGSIDLAEFDATIQVGAGTYNGEVYLYPYVGTGQIYIVGDAVTPSNVLISVTGSGERCFQAGQVPVGKYNLSGFKLQSTLGGALFFAGVVDFRFSEIDFGACGADHILATQHGRVSAQGDYTISGGANSHVKTTLVGTFFASSKTVTITGTPNFSNSFVYAANCGVSNIINITFSGAATGVRYEVEANGVIDTAGGGATFFPGDTAGVISTGGQYI